MSVGRQHIYMIRISVTGRVHLQGVENIGPYGKMHGHLPILTSSPDLPSPIIMQHVQLGSHNVSRTDTFRFGPFSSSHERIHFYIVFYELDILLYIIIVIVRARGRGYPKQYYITSLHDVCI